MRGLTSQEAAFLLGCVPHPSGKREEYPFSDGEKALATELVMRGLATVWTEPAVLIDGEHWDVHRYDLTAHGQLALRVWRIARTA